MVAPSGTSAPDINPSRKNPLSRQTAVYAHESTRWQQQVSATVPVNTRGVSEARHIPSHRIGPLPTQTSFRATASSSTSSDTTPRANNHVQSSSSSSRRGDSNNTNAVATTRAISDIHGFSNGPSSSYASASPDLAHHYNPTLHTVTTRQIGPAQHQKRRNTDGGSRIVPVTHPSSPVLQRNSPAASSPGAGSSGSPIRYARNNHHGRESPYTLRGPADLPRPRAHTDTATTTTAGPSSFLPAFEFRGIRTPDNIYDDDDNSSLFPELRIETSPQTPSTAPGGFSNGKGKEVERPREVETSDDKTKAVERRRKAHKNHRSRTRKEMLALALDKANTAVKLDNAENIEGALDAYRDACSLLGQVMMRTATEDDRTKLERIRETYLQRIEELEALPRCSIDERSLPPRPDSEIYTDSSSFMQHSDNASMHTHERYDEARAGYDAGPSGPPTGYSSTTMRSTTLPPRRDSLFSRSEGAGMPPQDRVPPIPPARSSASENAPSTASARTSGPLSPVRNGGPAARRGPGPAPQEPPPEPDGVPRGRPAQLNRESFMFGAPALSPRFSPRKEELYGVTRPGSNGSDAAERIHYIGNEPHSARDSAEGTTSWLNTIDESESSTGELSPEFMRHDYRMTADEQREFDRMGAQFEADFDSQLDAAVEAAYGDVYEVDYSNDREMTEEEEMAMLRSPRENVERAKQRVREAEREAEQRELQLRMERERKGYFAPPARDSLMDSNFFEGLDDDSEDERILDDLTKGFTMDVFDRDSMMALPKDRQSSSTQYTTSSSSMRGSHSSTHSGTTWGSSMSGYGSSISKTLTTVTEAPSTPPTMPPPSPPDRMLGRFGDDDDLKESPSKPPPPPPKSPGLMASPPPAMGSLRSRRLSALSEKLEPLKLGLSEAETTLNGTVPATVVEGPTPMDPPTGHKREPSDEYAAQGVPPPLSIPPKSPLPPLPPPSRPGTAAGVHRPIPESPEKEETPDVPDRNTMSPTLSTTGSFSITPMQKTLSDDGASMASRTDSPAKFTLRMPAMPLRQIHSSASLRSRAGTDDNSPVTPGGGLFASSSTTNLRKGLTTRSTTPGTPGMPPMTPMHLPNGANQAAAGGMSLFDGRLQPEDLETGEDMPLPLEPCPIEPLSKPYWLMRAFYQTIAHPKGGFVTTRLFIPREIWGLRGVKLKAEDEKILACDQVTSALISLASVKQDNIDAIFEEMQNLETVLERAQTLLSKKLGSEVGPTGARATYGDPNAGTPEGMIGAAPGDVVTKQGTVGGGTKSYFSLRKLRTKASSATMQQQSTLSPQSVVDTAVGSNPTVPTATDSTPANIPKRNPESIQYSGPHAPYAAALAKMFDSAQILDRLPPLWEDSPTKVLVKTKIGLELSHRNAAEFFGFYVCRFVLNDIMVLLDKFVKRSSDGGNALKNNVFY